MSPSTSTIISVSVIAVVTIVAACLSTESQATIIISAGTGFAALVYNNHMTAKAAATKVEEVASKVEIANEDLADKIDKNTQLTQDVHTVVVPK